MAGPVSRFWPAKNLHHFSCRRFQRADGLLLLLLLLLNLHLLLSFLRYTPLSSLLLPSPPSFPPHRPPFPSPPLLTPPLLTTLFLSPAPLRIPLLLLFPTSIPSFSTSSSYSSFFLLCLNCVQMQIGSSWKWTSPAGVFSSSFKNNQPKINNRKR